MLSAKNSSQDRVTGLKVGADDYLAKPFNLEELLLRVEKLLKRSQVVTKSEYQEFSFSGASVNFLTFEVQGVNGVKLTLTKKQVKLLKLLIDRQGQVVSREDILEKVSVSIKIVLLHLYSTLCTATSK